MWKSLLEKKVSGHISIASLKKGASRQCPNQDENGTPTVARRPEWLEKRPQKRLNSFMTWIVRFINIIIFLKILYYPEWEGVV